MFLDFLREIKERYLRAYRTQKEILESVIRNEERNLLDNSNFRYALTRASALDRINHPLEQLAMDFAWHEQRIRHPIKMYMLVKELNQ